jgi:arylformamidase
MITGGKIMSAKSSKAGSEWIDISVTLHEGMIAFSSEPLLQLERRRSIARGHKANNTTIHMSVHSGTHMDAPRHFVADGKTIDQMPFDITLGRARVIEITNPVSIKAEELAQHNIKRGERILLKTHNSPKFWQADAISMDYLYITRGAARFLVEAGVKLVGIDALSVGSPVDPDTTTPDTHQILLGNEIWIIEGLNLTGVNPGNYNLICLPLKLKDTEGSPVRAIISKL